MSNLPELPKPDEGKRPTPLARYATQQLTTAVPRPSSAQPFGDRAREMARVSISRAGDLLRAIPRRRLWWIGGGVVLFIFVVAAASGGGSSAGPAFMSAGQPAHADGDDDASEWIDSQLSTWRDEGLEPGGFADVDPSAFGASECRGGAAAALEVTLCSFATAAGAAGAIAAAEASIGANTGVVVAEGKKLLIVADRRSSDPGGRTINKLVNTLRR